MRAKVKVAQTEGFMKGLAIVIDDGLTLITAKDMHWCGKKKREEITAQFNTFLDQLRMSGWEVDTTELDNFRK